MLFGLIVVSCMVFLYGVATQLLLIGCGFVLVVWCACNSVVYSI